MNGLGSFSFKITSTDASPRVIVLIPGSFPVQGYSGADYDSLQIHQHDPTELKNAGKNIDFVLDDGQIDDGNSKVVVTSLSKRNSVRHFLNFIANYPHTCGKIVVQANNTDVYNESFNYGETTPLGVPGEREIPMRSYFSVNQNMDDKIEIPLVNFYLSKRSYLDFTIPGGGREVQITFDQLRPVK